MLNYNQTYKYRVTGADWGHSIIEPDLKAILNSYINYNGLGLFSYQEYKYILLKQLQIMQYFAIYLLFKTKKKVTDFKV